MITNYLKTAWRNLLRNKLYTTINIGGLALALAACWMIMLFVFDEFSYDRYNEHADRIVRVVQHTRWNGNDLHQAPVSAPFAPALKAAFPEIEDAVRIDAEGGGTITAGEKKIKQGDMIVADKSLLKIFSYQFLAGDQETALSKPQSIVVTKTLAEKLFGSADKAINQTIYLDENYPNTITAVIDDIPVNSHLRFSAVRSFNEGYTEGWQNFHIYTYLLLKKGVQRSELEKKLPQFAAQTIQAMMHIKDYRLELQPLTSIHLYSNLGYELGANGSISRVWGFMAIAVLILVIAIINYMNLSTARSSTRVREVGIRKVVGSGRRHIAGMMIMEALLITGIAALLAVLLSRLCMPWFNELTGKDLSVWRFGFLTTVLVLLLFSGATGVVSGLYPSFFLSAFKTIPALKGQMGNIHASVLFRKTLVVFQFVITVLMISCSAVIYRQLQFALHQDLGFNKEQVLTFHINDRAVREKIPHIKTTLLESPLIEGVAAAGNPIGNNDLGGLGYRFETAAGDFSAPTTVAQELMVDEDYLSTMEIRLLAGRNFSASMPTDQYGAALINETLQNKLGWKNALGKRMQFAIDDSGHTAERTIIGVIKDFHTYSLQHTVEPLVMVLPPVVSMKDNLYVKVGKGKEKEALAYLNQVYKQYDASGTTEYNFLDQNFARQYAAEEKQGRIAAVFTFLAILVACLGLFGLTTFAASQRAKEIGIRKVLGASVFSIVQLFSRDFLRLVGIATLIAVPVAWFLMHRWLQDFAYRTTMPWWIFGLAGLTVGMIALLTLSFQAVKSATANPVKSLKGE
ncbi:MAG: ABC transporter permease [Williamsia sp.]|nr:ABC transporter permease [Williamsia sp.]